MKIFTTQQIREGDAYTIRHEPVSSIDLMERAASRCVEWIRDCFCKNRPVYVFCGTGNNGGDGLAIARLLSESAYPDGGYDTRAYMVLYKEKLSDDCRTNRTRLEHAFGSPLHAIHAETDFPDVSPDAIIIDALFGTGLNRPLTGLAKKAVDWINRQEAPVISVDMPSGLMADVASAGHSVVRATYTLSFEFYKMAFLMPENNAFIGRLHVLPIGIHPDYTAGTDTPCRITDEKYIRSIYKRRDIFAHKGAYGHALLIAGSYGKAGAAVLAARACLRSGAGLLSCAVPACSIGVLQTAVPEAMCLQGGGDTHWMASPGQAGTYASIGVGPGIGQHADTAKALEDLLAATRQLPQCRLVIDADALNIIGKERWLEQIPPHALLTPHPKEFERLFGKTGDSFQRLALQMQKSREYNIYILLKGHYTSITSPEGRCFFNMTGNPGMATAGSGDTLTGILAGLMAQGYDPWQAAVFGAYLHGLAGDMAARERSPEAMIASDIVDCLGDAYITMGLSE